MEIFKGVVAWTVALSGFAGILIFGPQVKRLIEVKNSEPFSLVTIWGSAFIQIIMLTHAWLQHDWYLIFMMTIYVSLQMTLVYLIHYYRVYPGGRHGKT